MASPAKFDPSTHANQPLSIREKLCYGLGDVSHGLAVSSISVWFLYYLTDVAGLGAFMAGIAVTIGRLWDAVTDPIMGWITDHTKSRWGKRLPYLLFGAVPYALAYFALWVVPEFESQLSIFVYVTVTLLVFNTCLTVVFVPYTSLTAAITDDYNERTSITGYRMVSSQVAFLVGASVLPAVVIWVTSSENLASFHALFGSWANTAREGHFIAAAVFGLLMLCSVWTTFFGTTERNPEAPVKRDTIKATPLSYAASIVGQLKSNRPFLFSVLILLLSNCAATLAAVSLPYYLEYVLDMAALRSSIVFTLFLSAIVSVIIWVQIARRFGKAESYSIAMLGYVIVFCFMPFLEPGCNRLIYLMAVLIGFFHAAALTIPWAIVPDVVEYDELQSGTRREGLFYGGTTFSYKAATGFAFLISSVMLELSGYVPNVEQTAQAISAIKILIGPAPALFLIGAAFLGLNYPLNAKKHRSILKKLAARKFRASRVK